MAGIEAAHMTGHGGHAGLFRDRHELFCILEIIRNRNLDQDRLSRAHDLFALSAMHLSRRRKDHGVGTLNAFSEIVPPMGDSVFFGDCFRALRIAAD